MSRFFQNRPNGFALAAPVAGLVALAALTFSACDITSLNENPNDPSTVTTPNLLINVQNDVAANLNGAFTLGRFSNLYAQYWTQNQYTDEDRYGFPTARPGSNQGQWDDYYLALSNLQEIINISRDDPEANAGFGPANNQIAIAMIMQAFIYQNLTDIYGPVPFEEALQGRSDANFRPTYTEQEEVYRGIIDSLTAASEMIDTDAPTSTFPQADLVYGGDMERWQQLANSLKMRAGIRVADVAPDLAETAISEAEGQAFDEVGDAATIRFSSAPPNRNPIFVNYEVDNRDDWAIPEALLGTMNDLEDPRRPGYATETSEGYVPYTYGLTQSDASVRFAASLNPEDPQPFSRPSEFVRSATSPAFVMLYDEVLFIRAEAAERGFIGGDASGLYEDAIEASIQYWSTFTDGAVSTDGIDDYVSGVPYDNSNEWASASGDIETWEQTLGTQKWLALYMQGVQGWSEYRRLDFQNVLIPPPGNPAVEALGLDVSIPVRLPYPNGEATLNQAARDSAVVDFLGYETPQDDQGMRLWWDTQAPLD